MSKPTWILPIRVFGVFLGASGRIGETHVPHNVITSYFASRLVWFEAHGMDELSQDFFDIIE
jgi:hypothetical protein